MDTWTLKSCLNSLNVIELLDCKISNQVASANKQNFLQNESIFTFLLLTNWSQDKINRMQNNIHNILITRK